MFTVVLWQIKGGTSIHVHILQLPKMLNHFQSEIAVVRVYSDIYFWNTSSKTWDMKIKISLLIGEELSTVDSLLYVST